jgi:hypothetical protein
MLDCLAPAISTPRSDRLLRPAANRALALGLALALSVAAGPEARADAPSVRKDDKPADAPPAAPKKRKLDRRPKRGRGPARSKAPASPGPRAVAPRASLATVGLPDEAAAMKRAFADHRRAQLADAERLARADAQKDRWRAVLFEVRDLVSRTDSEACFWRVLAYLRLGEMRRAQVLRRTCEIAAHDSPALDGEEAAAARLQPASAEPELPVAGDVDGDDQGKSAHAVENGAAYAGPAPVRVD